MPWFCAEQAAARRLQPQRFLSLPLLDEITEWLSREPCVNSRSSSNWLRSARDCRKAAESCSLSAKSTADPPSTRVQRQPWPLLDVVRTFWRHLGRAAACLWEDPETQLCKPSNHINFATSTSFLSSPLSTADFLRQPLSATPFRLVSSLLATPVRFSSPTPD